MQNPKRLISLRGRATLLAGACMISPLMAGEPGNPASLADARISKTIAGAEEAQELLKKGDESYNAGRYSEAVQAYAGARELLPDVPNLSELHRAATDRYAQASVEYGRELARKGDVAGAKAAVDKVLIASVAPNDPGALAFRAQLDDPIRTNPALDKDHAKKVDQVRQLLYTAEGAYNLGSYDKAKSSYENVLRLDPYNTAARRGMERIAAAKSGYQKSAGDHARAEMLSMVDGAWETKLEPAPIDLNLPMPGVDQAPSFIPVANKLSRIIISKIDLEQSSLAEAVDFLRLKVGEVQGDLSGVNFTIELGDAAKAAEINAQRFDLRLSNTPLSGVLKYLTEITRTSFTTDEYSVIIRPLGGISSEIITRTYKVRPDFVSSLTSGTSPAAGAAAADPFASTPPAGGGLLQKFMGVQQALELQGVTFPQGASASINTATNTLRVANTPANQDIISQIVETTVQGETVMVAVRVTMIRTEQRNLEELGFDWLLSGAAVGANGFVSGGTQGNGGDLSDLNPDNVAPNRPLTAGNRSGNAAITGNAIDDIIGQGSDRGADIQTRAPGILGVNGLITGRSFSALMRGLSQKKGVDMLTNPSTVTRSGQASSIHIVREFIYPTSYEPPELPQTISSTEIYIDGVYVGSEGGNSFPVTPATPTDFKKRDVGVILEVLPTADANKQFVDITLNPSVTDFDGFVNYGSPINAPVSAGPLGGSAGIEVTPNDILMPVFSVHQANTALTVADGSTIVIGGLLKESVQNVEDKTPVLGSIPVVGRLFQSKARQPVSTAIVFLVNVQLVDPTGRPYRNR